MFASEWSSAKAYLQRWPELRSVSHAARVARKSNQSGCLALLFLGNYNGPASPLPKSHVRNAPRAVLGLSAEQCAHLKLLSWLRAQIPIARRASRLTITDFRFSHNGRIAEVHFRADDLEMFTRELIDPHAKEPTR